MAIGTAVCILGYAEPNLIAGGTRPYAYISVMGAGAMLIIMGALLWSDSDS
jgi:hypothetical protein